MKFDQSHLATLATRMSTSSAMNPALLLCLMVCPLSFAAACGLFYANIPLAAVVFVLIGVWPLGIAGWQLIKFTNTDPNRLQKEQHVENMLQIQNRLTVKDGDTLREVLVSESLTPNPQLGDMRGE